MLNKTLIIANRGPENTYSRHEVHEHRAPTDESVRLLKEFEGKAADKIVESIHVGNMTFECVIDWQRDCFSDSMIVRAIFSLNGKKLTAHFQKHSHEATLSAMIDGLRKAISDKIADEVIASTLKSASFKNWPLL